MTRRFASLLILILPLACQQVDQGAADSAAIQRPGEPQRAVTEHGLEPIRVGMTLSEARAALPRFELSAGVDSLACDYPAIDGLPEGVLVMVDQGTVARVDVKSATVPTAEGARVGDTEQRIQELYGARVSVMPHKYTDGHYLVVRSAAPDDTLHRIVFETDGSKVERYHAGRMPQVLYVEGCS
jgi:hypothetical protein